MGFVSRLLRNRLSSRYYKVLDSEDVFREKHKKEYYILENDEKTPGDVLLYDFNKYDITLRGGVVIPFPICETQLQNTDLFRSWFSSLLERSTHELDAVLREVELLLDCHLKSYAEELSKQKDLKIDDRERLIRSWHEVTTVLILDIFYKAPFKTLEIRDILKRALWVISRCMEDLLYPKERYDTSFIALYNLWGVAYQRMRSELFKNPIGLSVEQKALLFNDENKEFFNLKYCTDYETPICMVKKPKVFYQSVKIATLKFLESLFNDYIKRLRQSGIYDEKTTIRCIEEWKDITLREIERVSLVDIISTIINRQFPTSLDDLRNTTVNRDGITIITNIKSLQAGCFNIINGLVEDYRRQILDGCLKKSWSAKLLSVGIDFKGLHSDMVNEKIIPSTFSYTSFVDAFRNADFSSMIEDAKFMDTIKTEQGRPGLVQFLIKVVGGLVGDDWYYSAAESVYPKRKGKNAKFAIGKLRSTKFVATYAPKIFEGRIPGYKY